MQLRFRKLSSQKAQHENLLSKTMQNYSLETTFKYSTVNVRHSWHKLKGKKVWQNGEDRWKNNAQWEIRKRNELKALISLLIW